MAEAQDVDVQQLMERIRENIRRRRSLEPSPTSEPLASAFDNGQETPDFARLQALGDLGKVSFTSHRRLLGPLVVAVKTMLLKLLTPILERQAAYNAASAGAMVDLGTWMQTLERQQTRALQAVTEQLSTLERSHRQLRAEVSDLRADLSEEMTRAKGDLLARVAEEISACDSQLRREALATASDLRQELAAQSRATESARQALRERVSASERKWLRVLHTLEPGRLPDGPEARPPEEKPTLAPAELGPEFDYAGFEERFRGSEEDIKGRQRIYVPYFEGARNVVDLGCGRGEFLELLREHGIDARGVDLDLDMVLRCRDKDLDAVRADAFAYLGALSDDAVGGIFAAQLIEHLHPLRVIDLVKLCYRKLAPGGFLVLETPNPACLMVFADSFYRDLSHIQPIHHDTLKFLFEAAHFHQVEIKTLAPVDPSMRIPLLQTHDAAGLAPFNQGIERLNSLLFGFQDYAVIGRKGGAHVRETAFAPGPTAPGSAAPDVAPAGEHTMGPGREPYNREDALRFPLNVGGHDTGFRYIFDFTVAGKSLDLRPGAEVLDFASGSCFVSELLNRLGYVTTALDADPSILAIGRERLALDPRCDLSRTRFAAGEGMSLPFRGESFDGIVCMNALHHMPDYRTTLAEMYRVLRKGGRAVFSEPGSEHSKSPQSITAMQQYGVLEKDVHLSEIYRLAKEVGFQRMILKPYVYPEHVDLNFEELERFRAGERVSTAHLSHEEVADIVERSHALFYLEKGGARPLTSASADPGLLRAGLSLKECPARAGTGAVIKIVAVGQNRGKSVWLAKPRPFGGYVTLGVKVLSPHGRLLDDTRGRTLLQRDVSPGEAIEVSAEFSLKGLEPGRYRVLVDMVNEQVCWFQDVGSEVAERSLQIV